MRSGTLLKLGILIILITTLSSTFAFAEMDTVKGVDPENLRVRYGFGQFLTGYSVQFGPLMHMVTFGGRGGTFVGKNYKFYMGGGGVGFFSLGPVSGGGGYGNLDVGYRSAFGDSNVGYDVAAGFGFGGYGTETGGGGYYLGPTAGLGLFFGARKNNEIGIFGQTLINILDIQATVISVGVVFSGKSGSLYTDWADRNSLN